MEWLVQGQGQPFGGDWAGASDTRFCVTEGVSYVSPRTCCIVSSLDIKLLIPRLSQLTKSLSRYLLLILG